MTNPLESAREKPAPGGLPRCVFVTGPRGAGKTQWLQRQIRGIAEKEPGGGCAVLLAEEGRTRMERFCQVTAGVRVRRLLLPCTCCPGLADLPGALREVVEAVGPAWLFIEVPAVAAAGFVAEFDQALGWPRELALCLDRAWTLALRDEGLSPFQMALVNLADCIVPSAARDGFVRVAAGSPGAAI